MRKHTSPRSGGGDNGGRGGHGAGKSTNPDEGRGAQHGGQRRGQNGAHRSGRHGRAQRGDVRAAILRILAEGPAHGYQLMQTMAERTSGAWQPSPGAVYPALAQLEDEGLVWIEEAGGRRLAALTEAGRSLVGEGDAIADPFVDLDGPDERAELHRALEQLQVAVRALSTAGDADMAGQAVSVLTDARRALYLVLAERS